jgi:hypothetical protein
LGRLSFRRLVHRLVFPVLGILSFAAPGFTVSMGIGQMPSAMLAVGPSAAAVGSPSSDEIVQRLVEHNEQRADQLQSYSNVRHYSVAYHGFPAVLIGSMVVEATYDAPSTKQFRILTHTGSKMLLERVLTKLLESEKEAALDPGRTALTPTNYRFTLLGQDVVSGRQCYLFHVEPKVDSKFFYRGTVWVDAEDYAVTRIEAEPSKNPSFWIKKTRIEHVYAKTGQFWLPESNRSETAVRLGGNAVLTIDYGAYSVQSAVAR